MQKPKYFFVRISEDCSDSQWYKPGETYMVRQSTMGLFEPEFELLKNPYNYRVIKSLKHNLYSDYSFGMLYIYEKDVHSIFTTQESKNEDYLIFLDD